MEGKIHFLNTGHSDCIILESDGKIAMVDSAEDNDYPADKPHLNVPGYEDIVIDYLFKHFSDNNGKVNIDFILGTHAHSDHIGGFDTIINHPDVYIKNAYLKPYDESNIFIMEVKRWDNKEVYNQMLEAIKNRRINLIESFDNSETTLGDFKIHFYNAGQKQRRVKFGENINSVVTLASIGNMRVVLAGDLNNKSGDETKLAKRIGKVELLKVGHHGYTGSTSIAWAKALKPQYSVVCNTSKRIYPDVNLNLRLFANSKIYATVDCNGIIAHINETSISLETDIM